MSITKSKMRLISNNFQFVNNKKYQCDKEVNDVEIKDNMAQRKKKYLYLHSRGEREPSSGW